MTRLLNPKSPKIGNFVLMILIVYPGHGVFHLGAVLVFSKSVFGRGLKLPNWGKFVKNMVYLCRSMGILLQRGFALADSSRASNAVKSAGNDVGGGASSSTTA